MVSFKLTAPTFHLYIKTNIKMKKTQPVKLEKPKVFDIGVTASMRDKQRLFNEAKTIVEGFMSLDSVESLRSFENDFRGYLMNELRQRTSAFSYGWSDDKICEFFQVNLDHLGTIQHKYRQYRHFQWNEDFTQVVKPDNDLYATTEDELRRLELCEDLIRVAEKIKAEGYRVDLIQLSRAVSNAITPQGKANIYFIKQTKF